MPVVHPLVRSHGLPLAILAAFVCADSVLASVSSVTIVGWFKPNVVALTFLGATLCCVLLRPPHPAAEIAFYLCVWAIFSAAACILTYLAASYAGPLIDRHLLAMDGALGFNWFAWTGWLRTHPDLQTVLHAAYASLPWQVLASIILLSLRSGGRNEELLLAAAIALLLTATLATALPAVGPWDPATVGRLDLVMITEHVTTLRSGPSTFTLGELIGIVSFPSFHATLAVLFIYAHRGLVWTAVPFAALNAVMLLSVPSEGGHYLVDLFGGFAVAMISIAAAHLILARWGGAWSDPVALPPAIPPALHGAEHP